jgi:hypothetical protein
MIGEFMGARSFWMIPPIAALAWAIAAAPGCDVGDQICPDDTLYTDESDDCPYGPPGGPQLKRGRECPLIETFVTDGCEQVLFERDIFPIFTSDPLGNCTQAGCHGSEVVAINLKGATLPPDITPQAMYDVLAAYKNDAGDPYWGPNETRAWALCNILAQPGGGSPMPPSGFSDPTAAAKVAQWIACGMQVGGSISSGATSSSASSTGSGL